MSGPAPCLVCIQLECRFPHMGEKGPRVDSFVISVSPPSAGMGPGQAGGHQGNGTLNQVQKRPLLSPTIQTDLSRKMVAVSPYPTSCQEGEADGGRKPKNASFGAGSSVEGAHGDTSHPVSSPHLQGPRANPSPDDRTVQQNTAAECVQLHFSP